MQMQNEPFAFIFSLNLVQETSTMFIHYWSRTFILSLLCDPATLPVTTRTITATETSKTRALPTSRSTLSGKPPPSPLPLNACIVPKDAIETRRAKGTPVNDAALATLCRVSRRVENFLKDCSRRVQISEITVRQRPDTFASPGQGCCSPRMERYQGFVFVATPLIY